MAKPSGVRVQAWYQNLWSQKQPRLITICKLPLCLLSEVSPPPHILLPLRAVSAALRKESCSPAQGSCMKLNEMLGACVEGRFDLAQLPAALLPAAVPPCPGSRVEQGPQPRRALSALWVEVCLGGDLEEPVGSRRLFLPGLELLPSTELSVGPWRCLTHLVLAALVRHGCLSSCNGFCLAS